jgi:hypothetical protein
MALGTCERCGAAIHSPWDAVEVRTEYRRVAKLSRLRTWRDRLICLMCARAEWDQHDNPARAQQEALW